jgi:hypothetical protein
VGKSAKKAKSGHGLPLALYANHPLKPIVNATSATPSTRPVILSLLRIYMPGEIRTTNFLMVVCTPRWQLLMEILVS